MSTTTKPMIPYRNQKQAMVACGKRPSFDSRESLRLTRGAGSATYSRTLGGVVADHEGLLKTALTNEIRMEGMRRVENLFSSSQDFSDAAWKVYLVTKVGATTIDGVDCMEVSFDANNQAALYQNSITDVSSIYAMRAKVRAKTGTVNLRFAPGTTVGEWSSNINIGTTWVDIGYIAPSTLTGVVNSSIRNGTAGIAQSFYIATAQIEEVTGQSNQNPSEYVSVGVLSDPWHGYGVDGVNNFPYENGNTVDGNGVVTEAQSADITGFMGKLLEKTATNLCDHSESLGGTGWANTNLVIALNDAVAPDGKITLSKISDDVTSGEHIISNACVANNTDDYVTSIIVEDIDHRYLQLRLGQSGNYVYTNIDLQTGTVDATGSAGTGVYVASGIEALTGVNAGKYRVWVSGNTIGNGTTVNIAIYLAQSSGYTLNYSGSGTSIYLWGAQLEAGTYPTSYIKTTSSTVQRAADALSYQVAGNMPANDFWVMVAYSVPQAKGFVSGDPWWPLIGMNEQVSQDRQHLYLSSNLVPTVQKKTSGVSKSALNTTTTFSANDVMIMVGRFSTTQGITVFSKNVTTDSAIEKDSNTDAEAKADATLDTDFGICSERDDPVAAGVRTVGDIKFYPQDASDTIIEAAIEQLAGEMS